MHAFRQALALHRANADALLSMADTLNRRLGQRCTPVPENLMNCCEFVFRAGAMSMIIEAASELPSDYEIQLVAGMFHEDINDLAAATKCLST